jgi:esterase/lipase superfamily enzyme
MESSHMCVHGYTNSFIDSNIRLYTIANHLVGFLAVGVTWWAALLHLLSICYGP